MYGKDMREDPLFAELCRSMDVDFPSERYDKLCAIYVRNMARERALVKLAVFTSAYPKEWLGQLLGEDFDPRMMELIDPEEQDLLERARIWLSGPDHLRGLSSETMFKHLLGLPYGQMFYPRDEDDLGLCRRLLGDIPALRERLPEMAKVSPEWAEAVQKLQ